MPKNSRRPKTSAKYLNSEEAATDGIKNSKKAFNRFFKNDLYSRFDSDSNLILSRGAGNDDIVFSQDLSYF